MKIKTHFGALQGLLSGTLFWSAVVAVAWALYPLGAEGWAGAGFLLLFLGLPSTLLLQFFDGSVFEQVVCMSLLGYLQWPLIGMVAGIFYSSFSRKRTGASEKEWRT
jgi:ABC-type multidrug transport system permease subunit